MYDDFLKISGRFEDLKPTKESWVGESYESRLSAIMDNIIESTGFEPSKNMQPIREAVFKVKKETTIDELLSLSRRIKELFGLDCFQITVRRPSNTVHMLFDFNIRGKGKSVVLNRSDHIVLSVLILRHLDLSYPDCANKWMGYFLKGRYSDNENVFEDWLNNLKHKKLNKHDYHLAKEMSIFVEQMCQGMTIFGIRKKNRQTE